MSRTKNQPVAVLCDFDGTITECEVIGEIYKKFASGNCEHLVRLWTHGEISTLEEIRGCFATIHATRQEMENELLSISIDPDFPVFLDFCLRHGYQFAILSDGLQWYIEFILNRFGLSGVTIFANQIQFNPDGFEISFPWFDPKTPKRGTSKPMIIQRYHDMGCQVYFIGDGLSDLEAVHVADRVFAKGRLLEICVDNHIPVTGFSCFADLLNKLQF